MDFVFDFVYVGDGDAITVWCKNSENKDVVIFIDGGNIGFGEAVIKHYNNNIKPHLVKGNYNLAFINTHPHADHINGLIEIIEGIGEPFHTAIYNDPVEFITEEHRQKIKAAYLKKEDTDITHLYESFEQVERLNKFCADNGIKRFKGYSDNNGTSSWIKILSPSEDFYVNLVQYFSDIDFLKSVDFSPKPAGALNAITEINVPCAIIDEADDTSPENLTSIVLQFTDSKGINYLLTGDAGRDSFDNIESDGLTPSNIHLVQLPHHGSRRNINTQWICKLNPNVFFASAAGNDKHPRKALVNCIKRNLKDCKIYSTHTSKGVLSYCTNNAVFPNRNWSSAMPL